MTTANRHGCKTGGRSACKTKLAPKLASAAQISALNETLQLLLIAFVMLFKDWPTRLITITALVLIRRCNGSRRKR
jgi:hypothetical protein